MKRGNWLLIPVLLLNLSAGCLAKNISPAFALNRSELEVLLTEVPANTRAEILARPQEFLDLVSLCLTQPQEWLWLVDKTHNLAADYEPADLVDLKDYPLKISKPSLLVRKVILEELLAMCREMETAGLKLTSASTYRSYATQAWLFDYWTAQLGQAEAEIVSARPGTSQHQLGTTIDFFPIEDSFANQPEFDWLQANGWRYGFTLSYPDGYLEETGYTYEPWHWRYIGKPAAELCRNYFGGIQQFFLEFWAARRTAFAAAKL